MTAAGNREHLIGSVRRCSDQRRCASGAAKKDGALRRALLSTPRRGTNMTKRIAAAVALSFALASVTPAFAEGSFRNAAPQNFSAQELQAYGLDADATQRAVDLQSQGYEIRVLSDEEAAQYQAGITDNQCGPAPSTSSG
jgi:hypothetical protein